MARSKRITLLGERAGAPFSAWRINADFTVSGATLYTCNDKTPHVSARQAYTARGTWVCTDTKAAEYFTSQLNALDQANQRAIVAAHEAHQEYIKVSAQAREARDALRVFTNK